MVCTPAFESLSEQLLQISPTSVVIPNAFSSNDGPAPYTVVEAAFMNLQLPLPGLSFTPLGGDGYTLSSLITPMVQVTYRDGNNVLRAKFVQAPLQLSGTVTSQPDPNTLTWWVFMESGSIASAAVVDTTLSFTASAALEVIALPNTPRNFAVLQGFTCAQQPPVQAQCRSIFPLESYCQLSSVIPGSSMLAIPFTPLGTMPYINPVVTSLGGQPYVLRVVPQQSGATLLDLAFPILLSYTDATAQVQTQSTFLFMSLLMDGIASGPNTRIIANLAISDIIPSSTVSPPALTLVLLVLTGSIAAVDDLVLRLTTDTVQCGEAPVAACRPILPPPTAEITG